MIQTFWLGKIKGIENIPDKPCIIISNHESYLDFLLIGYVLKRKANKEFRFWAKTKVIKHSLWRFYSSMFDSIEVCECGNFRQLTELSLQTLNGGKFVCIFPEGRRSRNGNIQNFKAGYLKVAATSGIEIVPLFLENTFEIWPAHQKFPKPKRCSISIYPAYKIPKGMSDSEIDELNLMIRSEYDTYKLKVAN